MEGRRYLLDEPGLARARFPAHKDRLAGAGADSSQTLLNRRYLCSAADKDRLSSAGRTSRQRRGVDLHIPQASVAWTARSIARIG